jgi:hypothetical protein
LLQELLTKGSFTHSFSKPPRLLYTNKCYFAKNPAATASNKTNSVAQSSFNCALYCRFTWRGAALSCSPFSSHIQLVWQTSIALDTITVVQLRTLVVKTKLWKSKS